MLVKKPNYKIALIALVVLLFLGLGAGYYYMRGQKHAAVMGEMPPAPHSILIIDPGHGGADGGAISITGVHESEINLQIALVLEQLTALYGIPTEMTRRTAELDYPEDADSIRAKKVADTRARVALINEQTNAVVLSIHQNTYGAASVAGPQVLFAATDGSEAFAEFVQNALIAALEGTGLEQTRKVARVPRDVYLMNHITAPAVLVECGFLTNPREEEMLQTPAYQLRLAAALLSAYIAARDSLWAGVT